METKARSGERSKNDGYANTHVYVPYYHQPKKHATLSECCTGGL